MALVATLSGIVTAFGQPHRAFTTITGSSVNVQGGGLYANDSVSGAAQAVGQDFVTLLVAVPLLVLALIVTHRGSLRGHMLLAGALA